jgi:hypothetical protein
VGSPLISMTVCTFLVPKDNFDNHGQGGHACGILICHMPQPVVFLYATCLSRVISVPFFAGLPRTGRWGSVPKRYLGGFAELLASLRAAFSRGEHAETLLHYYDI